jgi:hypothetical protein
VLLLSAEDDLARTIKPRLLALGADLSRIHALPDVPAGKLRRPPVLPDDLPIVEALVVRHCVRLVVIDPLMAYLSGRVDSHKDSDIRLALYRVKLLAERTQAAVLVVRHLNKLVTVAEPLYRGGGSIGIIGAARSALLVGRHPGNPELRVLARSKGNLCAEPEALAYSIVAYEGSAIVQWQGPVNLTAADLLAKGGRAKKGEALEDATAFLRAELAGGAKPAEDVLARAKECGISERTLKRAKQELGVRAAKSGWDGAWTWTLPQEGQTARDTQPIGPLGQKTADSQCSSEGGQGSPAGPLGDAAASQGGHEYDVGTLGDDRIPDAAAAQGGQHATVSPGVGTEWQGEDGDAWERLSGEWGPYREGY